MSQYRRCETCILGGCERNENNMIVCNLFDDEHIAYDKCSYWQDEIEAKRKKKRKK